MIPCEGQKEESDSPDLLILDEDDQDRLIEELQQQNAVQQRQIERIFGYLCHVCAAMSIALGLFVEYRQWNTTSRSMAVRAASWAHVFVSFLQHVHSFGLRNQVASLVSTAVRPMAINALLAVGGMFLARRRHEDDRLHLHYSLLACNILVLSLGLVLRREQRLTLASINGLQSKKYHFKSL